jgi:hypothetical protein
LDLTGICAKVRSVSCARLEKPRRALPDGVSVLVHVEP